MCDLKSGTGRCHSHLKALISKLEDKDTETCVALAKAEGMVPDYNHIEAQMNAYDAKVAQERQVAKEDLLEAHAEAVNAKEEYKNATLSVRDIGKKIMTSNGVDATKEAVIQKLGNGHDSSRNPKDLQGFVGYDDVDGYISSYQFVAATEKKLQEAQAEFGPLREQHDKNIERQVLRGNVSLKAEKRRLRMASLKERVGQLYYSEFRQMQSQYDDNLEKAANGMFLETSRTHDFSDQKNKINRLQAEVKEANVAHYENRTRFQNHFFEKERKANGTANLTYAQQNIDTELRHSLAHDTAHYEKSRLTHTLKRYEKAKAHYVSLASDDTKTAKARDAQHTKVLRAAPPDPYQLSEFRKRKYPQTPEGKAIKKELDEAQRDIVLTQTYRTKLKARINYLEVSGQDATAEKQKLDRIMDKLISRDKPVAK